MARDVTFVIPLHFKAAMRGVFADEHIETVKNKLALRPQSGDLIPTTGGARKWRTA